MKVKAAVSLVVAMLVGACGEREISSPSNAPDLTAPGSPGSSTLQRIDCTGRLDSKVVKCGQPASGASADLIVGNQGGYVTLASSNVQYNSTTGAFTFDVTVTNLIPQAMGTNDGTTPDGTGVRVFFVSGPTITGGTGNASVGTADGTATFTTSGQPYYAYTSTPALLGADGILSQNETSSAKTWQLNIDNTVTTFTFNVYVSANVKHPTGYVDLTSPSPYLVASTAQAVTAVSRSAVGNSLTSTFTYASTNAAVATVDGSGNVTGVTPGATYIRVTSSLSKVDSLLIQVCPNLAIGEVYTTSGAAAASSCLSGYGGAEYTAMPYNTSTSSVSLTVTGNGIVPVTGPPSPDRIPMASGLTLASLPLAASTQIAASAHLAPNMVKRAGAVSKMMMMAPPTVGDPMTLNVAQGCNGIVDNRAGTVRSVSTHTIIVSDDANPAGGFTTAQYDSIALEHDSIAYAVDVAAFGAPTDLDGNGRTILFYTKAVNELDPIASTGPANYGYFTNRDIFDPSDCNLSNLGEILYMLVPDPTGSVKSNVRSVSSVRGATVRRQGHEFARLINATRRGYITGASNFEEGWLDEAIGDMAEELMFYSMSVGLAPGGNIQLSTLTSAPNASARVAAFNTYENENFDRLRGWLQRPDTAGVGSTNSASLAAQGSTWAFLRYAADRTGNSSAFTYALVNSNLEGMANISNAIGGAPATDWIRDFMLAMYADDAVSPVAAQYTNPSWNFRSVYTGLGGFPLGTRPLTDATALTLSYAARGTAFTRFGVPASSIATVTLKKGTADPDPATSWSIIRTK